MENYNISQIKNVLKNSSKEEVKEILSKLKYDKRKSVQNLYSNYLKKEKAIANEIERVTKLYDFQKEIEEKNFSKYCLCIDEVGRGPIAGPVTVAGVILDSFPEILYVNDSKKLTHKKRQAINKQVIEKKLIYSICSVDNKKIDDYGINIAIQIAIENLYKNIVATYDIIPDLLLLDGNLYIPNLKVKQLSIIKGDSKVYGISLASIIAKENRDNLMQKESEKYPEYFFEKNKGYGTKEHIDSIHYYGLCPIHRRSYTKNLKKNFI